MSEIKPKIGRILGGGILILLCFLLQNNLFGSISLIEISPNLLLLLTVTAGLLKGRTTGLLIGFFSGLFVDIFSGSVLGQFALILCLIGYSCGRLTDYFDMDMITLPLFVCAGSELVYGLYVYVTGFLPRGRWGLWYYLKNIILPETAYTLVILVVTYRFLLWGSEALHKRARRRRTR